MSLQNTTTNNNSNYTFYTIFNKLYEELILKLIEFFPPGRKLYFYHEIFIQFKKSDYKLPGRLFLSSVAEHSLYIFNKDESYFMNGIEVTKTRDRAIIEETIIGHWTQMSSTQREVIWFYLQSMLKVLMEINDDDICIQDDSAENEACSILKNALVNDGVLQFH